MTQEQLLTKDIVAFGSLGREAHPEPEAIHELMVVLEPRFMDTYWDTVDDLHHDFNWTHYEQSCERLMNKIRTGNTITRVVVTRRV